MKTIFSRAKTKLKLVRRVISSACPNTLVFNLILALPTFVKENRRLPRSPVLKDANINDFIFSKMIGDKWTLLEKTCVDKEYGKVVASGLCPDLQTPKNLGVFSVEGVRYEQFSRWLDSFSGKDLVAKPTHGSGCVLFLKDGVSDEQKRNLFDVARRNYSSINREMQYFDLEKKVIVEQDISSGQELLEYKFTCTRGKVLFCAVVTGRFANTAITFFSTPDFQRLDVRLGHYAVAEQMTRPPFFDDMCRIAAKLSENFDFVRVDLYEAQGEIFFGELTFTPGAGAFKFSNEAFASDMLREVMAAHPETFDPIAAHHPVRGEFGAGLSSTRRPA